MSARHAEFGQSTRLALVTFTTTDQLDRYRQVTPTAFPVLLDQDRAAYRAYGLGRGSRTRVWGWRAARRYAELLAAGGIRRLRRPTEDTLQLGGDFVVAPDGTLAWSHHGAGPDDRPSVDEIVEVVASLT